MISEISRQFGHTVRVRVCGLCWMDDKLLLVNHQGLVNGDFWAPPGGGVEFGQQTGDVLIREFREETGLNIRVVAFRFICEFMKAPLHAIEVFFDVDRIGGQLKTGVDPEMGRNQIIQEVRFISWPEIERTDESNKHGIFRYCKSPKDLKEMAGLYRI